MQNKVPMIDGPIATVLPQLSTKQSQVYRIRKILLILLGALFAFDLIYLIFGVHAYIDNLWISQYFKNNYELLWTIMSVIYDAFGLFVTYQYCRRGLFVFAWIGIICLILSYVGIGIIFIAAFYTKRDETVADVDVIGPIIFIIMFVASSIMLLIIVLISLKLSKLLSYNRHATSQSI